MFLKSELTTKLFDDGKWIRSLTAAEEVTGGVPEAHVTYAAGCVRAKPHL